VRVGANLHARAAVIASMAERSALLSSMRGGLLRMGILAGHAAYETGNATAFDASAYKQARTQLESELQALSGELGTPTGQVAGGAVSQAIWAISIEVSDNGPGIDPDAHQKIFEPFVRVSSRDRTGLGLGLATVRRLVDGYGGDIGLRSHPGAGSCFYLKLPLRQ